MKILLINKFHYLEGGAERSYFDTADILKSHGHDLAFFSMKHPKNKPSRWSKYFVSNVDYNKKHSLIEKIKPSINISVSHHLVWPFINENTTLNKPRQPTISKIGLP